MIPRCLYSIPCYLPRLLVSLDGRCIFQMIFVFVARYPAAKIASIIPSRQHAGYSCSACSQCGCKGHPTNGREPKSYLRYLHIHVLCIYSPPAARPTAFGTCSSALVEDHTHIYEAVPTSKPASTGVPGCYSSCQTLKIANGPSCENTPYGKHIDRDL